MPKSINNESVSWSVKEIKIGEQNAETDGTFTNYDVEYSDVATTTDDFRQTITNTLTVEYTEELPSTGGAGIWYIYCLGLLCIGGVVIFGIYQRRKRKPKQ